MIPREVPTAGVLCLRKIQGDTGSSSYELDLSLRVGYIVRSMNISSMSKGYQLRTGLNGILLKRTVVQSRYQILSPMAGRTPIFCHDSKDTAAF